MDETVRSAGPKVPLQNKVEYLKIRRGIGEPPSPSRIYDHHLHNYMILCYSKNELMIFPRENVEREYKWDWEV